MIKLLTIGNSFSGNALHFMNDIFEADGNVQVCYGRADLGGCYLEKHWNLVEQCELLSDVKPYNFAYNDDHANSTPMTLKEILVTEKWDIITMQQVSSQSFIKDSYEPYFSRLHNLVKELAPQAEILLHQTWSYRQDEPLLEELEMTPKQMFERLKAIYAELAEEYSCSVIPSGQAFEDARRVLQFEQDKSFNFENPPFMELPDQSKSLIVGHHWKTGNTPTGNPTFECDSRHANHAGCYLLGALWFEIVTGKSILSNSFVPDGMSSEDVDFLKQIAHNLVK